MIRNIKARNVEFKKGRPLVCVPVQGANIEFIVFELEKTKGADIIEWRADFFREDVIYNAAAVKEACGDKPLLITFRTKAEGGKADFDDQKYFDVVSRVIKEAKPDLIDIEFSNLYAEELIILAKQYGVISVVSSHNFESTASEEEMIALLNKMEKAGADIPKLAQMPNNFGDVLNLLSATYKVSEENFPIVTMSMGKIGKITRLAGSGSGSAMTFGASVTASAPGQLKAVFLNEILDELEK